MHSNKLEFNHDNVIKQFFNNHGVLVNRKFETIKFASKKIRKLKLRLKPIICILIRHIVILSIQ